VSQNSENGVVAMKGKFVVEDRDLKKSILYSLMVFASVAFLGGVAPASSVARDLDCKKLSDPNLVSCSYEATPASGPVSMKLEVAGDARKIESVSTYPGTGQKTAILFLLDVSDPSREKVVRSNVAQIRLMLDSLKPHQQVGLATFDSQYRLLAPVGSSPSKVKAALSEVRAGGAATEFYKNIISGAKAIGTVKADRRVLMLFSDGKAEDKAYSREDAIKELRSSKATLVGLGFADSPSQTPALQTIERLANDTGGVFVKADLGYRLPEKFLTKPFAAAETGGVFTFNVRDVFGNVDIEAIITSNKKQTAKLHARFSTNAGRSYLQNSIAFFFSYWIHLVIGLLLLVGTVFGALRYKKMVAARNVPSLDFGYLEELDGQGTTHSLNRQALRIGRGDDSDVQLLNSSVSRNHAELHRRDDGWHLVDLGSTNGVRVNDATISNAVLGSGDIIEVGEVRFRFVEY